MAGDDARETARRTRRHRGGSTRREKGLGAANRVRYSNPPVDALIVVALCEMDPEKRSAKVAAAIEAAMRQAGVRTMLHGHTHRPAVHEFELDGDAAKRIVLGDWYEQGSVVRWDDDGPVLVDLRR